MIDRDHRKIFEGVQGVGIARVLPSPSPPLPLIHRATAREKLDRNVETKRRGNVLATTSTQSRNSVEDEIWRKKRGRGREREAQKTHPSFSRASFLLSSSLLFTMLFHLVLFAHLSSSYSPTRAKLASEVRVTQPPRVVEKTTIHPSVLCPEKSQRSPLLLARPDLASSRTNNTRSGHVACTCIHTALFIRETLLSIFLSLLFLSSRDRDEWKSNGEYDSMTDGGTVDYYF